MRGWTLQARDSQQGRWVRGAFTHLADVQMRVQSTGEQPCCCSGFVLVTPLEKSGVNQALEELVASYFPPALLCAPLPVITRGTKPGLYFSEWLWIKPQINSG